MTIRRNIQLVRRHDARSCVAVIGASDSPFLARSTDEVLEIDLRGGDVDVHLPPAEPGTPMLLRVLWPGGGALRVFGNGSDVENPAALGVFNPVVTVTASLFAVVFDGSQWLISVGASGVSNPMTEDLDANGFRIFDLEGLDFDEVDDGNSGSAKTIDWSAGSKHTIVLTGDAVLTFVPPPPSADVDNLMFHVVQDGVGARVPSWPANILWSGASGPPTLATAPGGEDLIAFYYRRANAKFYGVLSPNFA